MRKSQHNEINKSVGRFLLFLDSPSIDPVPSSRPYYLLTTVAPFTFSQIRCLLLFNHSPQLTFLLNFLKSRPDPFGSNYFQDLQSSIISKPLAFRNLNSKYEINKISKVLIKVGRNCFNPKKDGWDQFHSPFPLWFFKQCIF